MSQIDTNGLLPNGAPALGDGGIATALQAAGLPLGEAPEAWSLTHGESLREVHAAYRSAGAAWATANTFRAHPEFMAELLGHARAGAPGVPLLGSIGPAPAVDRAPAAHYAAVAEALVVGGADAALVETITHLEDGIAAVRAARAAGFACVIASVTPNAEGDLLDGAPLEAAARRLVAAGATVVGLNCGTGPEAMLLPVRRLVAAQEAPVYAAPNAGLPSIAAGLARYAVRPDSFAEAAIRFVEAGACLVAGCCGVGPEHIRAAASRLAARRPRTAE